MKKLIYVLTTTVMILMSGINVSVSAQGKYGADSADCIKYLSYYKEYYKQKNYKDAIPNWRKAYKLCPASARQTMLIDGTSLLRKLIDKNSDNKEYREALIDSLLVLHDQRAEYFPKYAIKALNNKARDISNFKQSDNEFMYKELNKIIEQNGYKINAPSLLFELKAAIELFKTGKMDSEEVINTYQKNMEVIEKKMEDPGEGDMIDQIKKDMESLFITSDVASCEKLIELFTPRYNANPKDLTLVKNIVKMLSSVDNCTDGELYFNAATAMYDMEPSAQSAYFLYKLCSSRDMKDEAVKYLEEAVASPDLDAGKAADYNYELAVYALHCEKYAKSFSAAKKVMELDESYTGKAYFIMGSIWGAVTCGGDEISKRAKFWVATDYMQKAKSADGSLTDDCNARIREFSRFYPTAADAFMYDLAAGQEYTVSCGGMTASTTVRTND